MATPKPTSGGSDKKFFDVAKPGKAMPPSTSRPAIVGHRTLLKDPMVTTEVVAGKAADTDQSVPAEAEKVVSTTAPTLQPITVQSSDQKPDEPVAAEEVSKAEGNPENPQPVSADQPDLPKSPTAQPATTSSTTKSESVTVSKSTDSSPARTTKVDGPAAANATSDSADGANPVGSSTATAEAEAMVAKSEAEKQAEKAAEDAAARAEAVEKLIAERKYFLPVGEHRRKRSKKHLGGILVLCLLLAAVLGYLAVDSGMIDAPFELPVRLFRPE